MRSIWLVVFWVVFSQMSCAASDSSRIVHAQVVDAVPASFMKLRITNDSIDANDKLNEEVVDMIKVDERDHKVPTTYTTHQGGGFGWFIHMIGYYWKAVDRQRYKMVGTANRLFSEPGEKDFLTEHDVNVNLVPHLQPYLDLVYRGKTEQTKRKQFSRARHADVTKAPFIPPTPETNELYDIHCELTPPRSMRDSLNVLFYPCMHGFNIDKHPNFGDQKPTMGLYGVFVLDCNHACHPEIHPYEWIWWLKLTAQEKQKGNFDKTWMLGFFKESSDRFLLWTVSPRVGTVSVPFIFRTTETRSYLKLDHLVSGAFRPAGIRRMNGIPKHTDVFDFTDKEIPISLSNGHIFPLDLRADAAFKTKALRWWLSDVQTDAKGEWVWGYINMAVSVRNGYTAKLESVARK